MIDLNSSAIFSDQLNFHLDEAIVRDAEAQEPRTYLGASLLGYECDRLIQYRFLRTAPDDGVSAKLQRIFARGHDGEARVIGWFKRAGFLLMDRNPATGEQWEMSLFDGRVLGHADGIFADAGRPMPFVAPALWECKVLGDKGWKRLVKDGLRKAYPHYYGQVQLLMTGLGLTKNPAIVTAVNGNDLSMHHEKVPYNSAEADLVAGRAHRILLALDAGETLPRGFMTPDYMECRWCDFRRRCWEIEQ